MVIKLWVRDTCRIATCTKFVSLKSRRCAFKHSKIDSRCRYIGHSLSLCVKDILSGKIPLKCVKGIHSGTCITSFEELFEVVRVYQTTYWEEFSSHEIINTLNNIFFGNKIFYQVRLKPGKHKVLRQVWTKA